MIRVVFVDCRQLVTHFTLPNLLWKIFDVKFLSGKKPDLNYKISFVQTFLILHFRLNFFIFLFYLIKYLQEMADHSFCEQGFFLDFLVPGPDKNKENDLDKNLDKRNPASAKSFVKNIHTDGATGEHILVF